MNIINSALSLSLSLSLFKGGGTLHTHTYTQYRGGTEMSKVIRHVRLHARPKILYTIKIDYYRSVLMAMINVISISFNKVL